MAWQNKCLLTEKAFYTYPEIDIAKLSVCNVHFKLALSTEYKNSFPIDLVLSLYTKI